MNNTYNRMLTLVVNEGKSKSGEQWRTFPYKTKSGKPAKLQVQKGKHQQDVGDMWDDMEHPVKNIKRTRVTRPIPSWMGMKGTMVHHTTSKPQDDSDSLWAQGDPDTNLIAPKSIKKHTTITAKIPGGKQVRSKRFPTSHDVDTSQEAQDDRAKIRKRTEKYVGTPGVSKKDKKEILKGKRDTRINSGDKPLSRSEISGRGGPGWDTPEITKKLRAAKQAGGGKITPL